MTRTVKKLSSSDTDDCIELRKMCIDQCAIEKADANPTNGGIELTPWPCSKQIMYENGAYMCVRETIIYSDQFIREDSGRRITPNMVVDIVERRKRIKGSFESMVEPRFIPQDALSNADKIEEKSDTFGRLSSDGWIKLISENGTIFCRPYDGSFSPKVYKVTSIDIF